MYTSPRLPDKFHSMLLELIWVAVIDHKILFIRQK
jgi:hypothetical protein